MEFEDVVCILYMYVQMYVWMYLFTVLYVCGCVISMHAIYI